MMTRAEYLDALEAKLARVPFAEKIEALRYVDEYFEEAGESHEEEVIAELGPVDDYAASLMDDLLQIPPLPDAEQICKPSEPQDTDQNFSNGGVTEPFRAEKSDRQDTLEQTQNLVIRILLIAAIPLLGVGIFFAASLIACAVVIMILQALIVITFALASLCGIGVYGYRLFGLIGTDPMVQLFLVGLILVCAGVCCLMISYGKALFTKGFPGFFSLLKKWICKAFDQLAGLYRTAWKGEST